MEIQSFFQGSFINDVTRLQKFILGDMGAGASNQSVYRAYQGYQTNHLSLDKLRFEAYGEIFYFVQSVG